MWRDGSTQAPSIVKCGLADVPEISEIVNEASTAYRGVIPADCWKEPYMPREELEDELAAGVEFWAHRRGEIFTAVMGLQAVQDVALIRHAYTRVAEQGKGIGAALLDHLVSRTGRPILIGTWKAATWAVRFYERRGFHLVPEDEKVRLLRRYWTIPDRQIEESVVLAGDPRSRA